jgi:hypothetical protein
MQAFEDEQGLVRDLLWYSDMTIGPAGECRTFERRMGEVRERYPPLTMPGARRRPRTFDVEGRRTVPSERARPAA